MICLRILGVQLQRPQIRGGGILQAMIDLLYTFLNPAPDLTVATNRISPQSQALLGYYPAPNIATTGAQGYNYQTITTAGQNSLSATGRYVRNFGQNSGFGGFGGFALRHKVQAQVQHDAGLIAVELDRSVIGDLGGGGVALQIERHAQIRPGVA